MQSIQNKGSILHSGLKTLRAQLCNQVRPMSTLLNSPDSKVLYQKHSDSVFEF